MQIVSGFILREVAGETIAVPTGEAAVQFSGLLSLNGSGKFLFELLQNDQTEDQLVEALLREYEIDEATARSDVREYVAQFRESGLILP